MSTPELSQSAEENLRAIRSLMERATVYRAISAAPAALAGVLAIGLGAWMRARPEPVSPGLFVGAWLVALMAVDVFNTLLLYREARRRGAPFPSSSMMHGVFALAPPMAACGIIGLALAWPGGELVRGALMWVIGYGLGLLATASFAPRSIRALGWGFLVTGVAWFLWHLLRPAGAAEPDREAALIMAVTFGGFHLVYAVRTGWWKRRSDS